MTAACLGLGMQKFSDPCRQQAVTAEDPVLQGLREGLGIWGCRLFWSEFKAVALWDVDCDKGTVLPRRSEKPQSPKFLGNFKNQP